MKFAILFVLPFTLAFSYTSAQAADKEEKVEIKSKDDGKKYKVKIKRKGKDYVGVSENKEYVLKGEPVTTLKSEGDYEVYGTMSDDGRFIQTTRIEPVVVNESVKIDEPVNVKVEEKPVKTEKFEEKIEIEQK
jgi:hypothetical protein